METTPAAFGKQFFTLTFAPKGRLRPFLRWGNSANRPLYYYFSNNIINYNLFSGFIPCLRIKDWLEQPLNSLLNDRNDIKQIVTFQCHFNVMMYTKLMCTCNNFELFKPKHCTAQQWKWCMWEDISGSHLRKISSLSSSCQNGGQREWGVRGWKLHESHGVT